jgi:hypothetical protein
MDLLSLDYPDPWRFFQQLVECSLKGIFRKAAITA